MSFQGHRSTCGVLSVQINCDILNLSDTSDSTQQIIIKSSSFFFFLNFTTNQLQNSWLGEEEVVVFAFLYNAFNLNQNAIVFS